MKLKKIQLIVRFAILAIWQITFIMLKACGVVSWSWFWVFIPIWSVFILSAFTLFIYWVITVISNL